MQGREGRMVSIKIDHPRWFKSKTALQCTDIICEIMQCVSMHTNAELQCNNFAGVFWSSIRWKIRLIAWWLHARIEVFIFTAIVMESTGPVQDFTWFNRSYPKEPPAAYYEDSKKWKHATSLLGTSNVWTNRSSANITSWGFPCMVLKDLGYQASLFIRQPWSLQRPLNMGRDAFNHYTALWDAWEDVLHPWKGTLLGTHCMSKLDYGKGMQGVFSTLRGVDSMNCFFRRGISKHLEYNYDWAP